MRIIRWIFSALLLIGGGALTYLVYSENQLAGSLTGLLSLIVAWSSLAGRRSTFRPGVNNEANTPTAIAMRQTRAMIRREEGEISGTTSAPT